MDCYWIHNSETQLASLRKAAKGVAVLPVSSIESHGPHLPLGSDFLCLDHVIQLVVEKEKVAVLPNLPYTFVAEARCLPGAVHIRSEVLMDFAECIFDEVSRNGFNKIAVVHGHGGNIFLGEALRRRALEKEKEYAVYIVPVFAGKDEEMRALLETTEYGHACEYETSLNMVACPELVNLRALGKKSYKSYPGPDAGSASASGDWCIRHPEMVVGIPLKATRAKGEAIARLWAEGLTETLRKIKRDKLCLKGMKQYRTRTRLKGRIE